MTRRKTRHTTGIRGTGTVDAAALWLVAECSRVGCEHFLRVSEADLAAAAITGVVKCPECGWENDLDWVESGVQMKYCRICERLQPLESFHRHKPTGRSFRTGRQLECRECKNTKINPALNPLRTPDQHREAGQRRRLYGTLAGQSGKLNMETVFEKFEHKCFNCNTPLQTDGSLGRFALDHTLPVKLLWPMTTETATLLCSDCNGRKHEQWPSQFYTEHQLRALARLTGIPYDVLSGPPTVNRQAVDAILQDVDGFIEAWIDRPEELRRVRRLILEAVGVDIAAEATHAPDWLST
jgi:hypothetical protein